MTPTRAAVLVAGTATLWGSVGVVIRQVDLPAVAVVSARVWLAAPALALFLRFRRPSTPWQWRPSKLLLLNGLVLAAHWVSFIAALQRAPIGTVLLITYLAPIGIAALAPGYLGESVPVRTILSLGFAVAGIGLIAVPAMDGTTGDGIALAFLTGALYVPLALLNKKLSGSHGGANLALWQLVIAGIAVLPFAALADWGEPAGDWAWLVVLALVYTAFAFAAYLTALERLAATRAAVLLYLEPASAVAFGWLLLDESLTPSMIVGGLLVVGAGVLVAREPMSPDVPPVVPEVTDVPRRGPAAPARARVRRSDGSRQHRRARATAGDARRRRPRAGPRGS